MPEILSTMQQEYEDRLKNDKKLSQIRKQIKAGATYSEAEAYAARSGEILSGVLKNNINVDVFANEDLNGLVVPMMRANYEKVVSATSAVQTTLNQAANIGIKPIVPGFDEDAAFNLVDKMCGYDSFEEAEWLLGEPVVTNSLKCVDDMLYENADFQYRSGMSPKIVRTAESDCCDWCASLEGVYEYSDLSSYDDVWKRHANCRCEVTFVPGDGRGQDVWSKRWLGDSEPGKIKRRISASAFSDENTDFNANERLAIVRANQEDGDMRKPSSLDGDYYDFKTLSLEPEAIKLCNELNELSKRSDFEYGKIVFPGADTNVFTDNKHSSIDFHLKGIDSKQIELFHSHTDDSLPSAADLRSFIDERVQRIGVISINKDVWVVEIGQGLRPTAEEFDAAKKIAYEGALEAVKNDPNFIDWTYEERYYMLIREQSLRICNYFEWDYSGGSLDE